MPALGQSEWTTCASQNTLDWIGYISRILPFFVFTLCGLRNSFSFVTTVLTLHIKPYSLFPTCGRKASYPKGYFLRLEQTAKNNALAMLVNCKPAYAQRWINTYVCMTIALAAGNRATSNRPIPVCTDWTKPVSSRKLNAIKQSGTWQPADE